MIIWVLRPFLYSSSVYSYHLFLISSASVRSLLFLSFFVPIFLICPVFLKTSLKFFPFYSFILFLCIVHICVSWCVCIFVCECIWSMFAVLPGEYWRAEVCSEPRMATWDTTGTPVEPCLSIHWLRGCQQASFHLPPVLPRQFVLNHFLFYFFAKNANMASVHLFIYPRNVSLSLAWPRYVSWWVRSDLKSRCWTWRRNLRLPGEGCGRDIIQMCNFCEEWEAGAGEEATGHVAVDAMATSSPRGPWGQESSC